MTIDSGNRSRPILIALSILAGSLHALAADGDITSMIPVDSSQFPDASDHASELDIFRIIYKSGGNNALAIHGYLLIPKKVDVKERAPCMIYNRGGNNQDLNAAALAAGTATRARETGAITDRMACKLLADYSGGKYVLIAGQYRGYGVDTDLPATDEFGGEDVEDVINLIASLDQLFSGEYLNTVPADQNPPDDLQQRVDSGLICMNGWSRGGMMTYLALRRLKARNQANRIRAAIVGAGVTDLLDSEFRRPGLRSSVHEKLIPNYANDRIGVLRERSAVFWPDELPRTQLLLLHGTADKSVDISQARRMVRALHEVDHPTDFLFVEEYDHSFGRSRGFKFRMPVIHTWLKGPMELGD